MTARLLWKRTRLGRLGASILLASTLSCSEAPDEKTGAGRLPVDGEPNTGEGDQSGGDGDSSNSGDGDSRPTEPDAHEPDACVDVETTPVRTVPSVVFLVDGSTSMKCVYPEDPSCSCDQQLAKSCQPLGAKSRWQALSEALMGVGGEPGIIANLGSVIRFGLWIYNDDPQTDTCPGFPTKVNPALTQAQALTSAFPAEPPGYNTPTGPALAALVSALPDPAQRDQTQLGPQRIVLATDGEPYACVDRDTLEKPPLDYQSVLDATDQARSKDVDVYVMSLAPTMGMFADHLQQVAMQGHTQQAYTPANKAQLSKALEDIIADAISCTLEIEGEINDPRSCKGLAKLGESFLRCGDADGFSILDAHHVRLEGAACERFKREPGIALSLKFPCFQLI